MSPIEKLCNKHIRQCLSKRNEKKRRCYTFKLTYILNKHNAHLLIIIIASGNNLIDLLLEYFLYISLYILNDDTILFKSRYFVKTLFRFFFLKIFLPIRRCFYVQ